MCIRQGGVSPQGIHKLIKNDVCDFRTKKTVENSVRDGTVASTLSS